MSHSNLIKNSLLSQTDPEKAAYLPKFFKAYPGGYGEGDEFIGVSVPNQRETARKYYKDISLAETGELLRDPVHECRLTALFILVLKYEKAKTAAEQQAIVGLYLENVAHINNWDLVDSSAGQILGAYLSDKDKSLLYDFARSGDLWRQRIAIIATFRLIRAGRYDDTLRLAEILLDHRHDLIHKAVGWMLREVGERDFATEVAFLKDHYQRMPRTTLRYAIEKFPEDLRRRFLSGEV